MAGRPVELRFITHKTIGGVEWSDRPGTPPLVALGGGNGNSWDKAGGALARDFRVVAISPTTPYELINVIWNLGEPSVVVAQGRLQCTLAARAAMSGAGAVRALVLIEFGGHGSDEWLREVNVPTLVLRGRQSTTQSHREAVVLHELIRNSHLIEPEDCGDNALEKSPGVIAEAISWYLGSLGEETMDFPVNGPPTDPKA